MAVTTNHKAADPNGSSTRRNELSSMRAVDEACGQRWLLHTAGRGEMVIRIFLLKKRR